MEREEKRELLRARTVHAIKVADIDGMDRNFIVFAVTDSANIDIHDGPDEHRVVIVSRGSFRRRWERFNVCARIRHIHDWCWSLGSFGGSSVGSWGVLLTMFNYGHKQVPLGVFAALSVLHWGWVAFVIWYDDKCKKKPMSA